MRLWRIVSTLAGVGACLALLGNPAAAETRNVTLSGQEEVPAVITGASGEFRARIANDEQSIDYTLSYDGVEGGLTQAHIHVGQAGANGGVVLFLCANPPIVPPPGTPACPPAPATVSGTLSADDVVPVLTQGIGPGQLGDIIRAIREGLAYVNVHSSVSPGGAVRGQFSGGGHH